MKKFVVGALILALSGCLASCKDTKGTDVNVADDVLTFETVEETEYESNTKIDIADITLCDVETESVKGETQECEFTAKFIDEVTEDTSEYPEYDLTGGLTENTCVMVLYPSEDCSNVKFFHVSMTDVDENGVPNYESETRLELDEIKKGQPIKLKVVFIGDSVEWQVYLEDSETVEHTYDIAVSGKDGSIQVLRYGSIVD